MDKGRFNRVKLTVETVKYEKVIKTHIFTGFLLQKCLYYRLVQRMKLQKFQSLELE